MVLPGKRLITDKEIRDVLLTIDVSEEITVTTDEAAFLDSVVYGSGAEWTIAQRARAAQIAEKYRHQL